MTQINPTPINEWKQSAQSRGINVVGPVALPSGNVCLARRPGVDTFVKLGLIPNSLLSIVQQSIADAQKGKQTDPGEAFAALVDDPQKLTDVMQLADNVCLHCVVEPKIHAIPATGQDRDNDALYVDDIDLDDKLFLFNWAVGGTSDLEKFREQQSDAVASLPAREDVGLPS